MHANTQVTVQAEAGLAFKLQSLQMHDGLGTPFEIELVLLSEDFDIDFSRLLGRGLAVRVQAPREAARHFHGLVAQVALTGSSGRFASYAVSLRPWLWFLQQAVDCRIFQQLSVPQILCEEVFKRHGFDAIDNQLTGHYAPREYCVQYGESDFQFASRLMEDEGLYYYFRHEARRHVLVLCDSARAHGPAAGCEQLAYRPQTAPEVDPQRGITSWHEACQVVPGSALLRDHDPFKPGTPVQAESQAPAQQAQAHFTQFEFGRGLPNTSVASSRAKLRRQALQGERQRFSGSGNVVGLGVGQVFELQRHQRARLNQRYLVTTASHTLNSHEFERGAGQAAPGFAMRSQYSAVTQAQGFAPPLRTPRPTMHGPQTARVEGPQASEIHTDAHGRVKVRFHWDRSRAQAGQASCWLRVSQGAAGKGFGQVSLPRVGDEVIVDFLHGDPDQPIVTGRVYNADRPLPYTLPEHKTRSTYKTRSTPQGRDDQYNELRFEDKAGAEEIYLHAQRDFVREVQHNDTLTVGQDRKTTIEHGNDLLQVLAGSHTLEAQQSITLKVGNNSLTIDATGITLKATQVKLQGQAGVQIEGLQVGVKARTALDLQALVTQIDSTALLTLNGALVKIN